MKIKGAATAEIFIDRYHPKKNGTCTIRIKVTHNRERIYYSTSIFLLPDEFDKLITANRRTREQKEVYTKLLYFLTKAQKAIDRLPIFTFSKFEEIFLEGRNVENSVYYAFEKRIVQLKSENKVGTAVTYQCALNSLKDFTKKLTFADVTPTFLSKYEKWMLNQGNSITTVGIYIRNLRAIFNHENIDKSLYPFGENKYKIPTGRNIKKALTLDEISRIYQYDTDPGSMAEMAKDYWIFLYLCNGMNVKDFCLLKWKNINGNILRYDRAKTQRATKDRKSITVALKAETMEIIRKWGRVSINSDAYIFPHINPGMDATRQREVCQQVTKNINKYMKRIATELNIGKEVTTYFARHSFATILKRSGVQTEMISELLGHSSMNVTENYLDSFENDQIQEKTDVLTSTFKKVK